MPSRLESWQPDCTSSLITFLADLLAGYIGSASLLKTVVRLVELLRQHNPNLAYGAPINITKMGHLLSCSSGLTIVSKLSAARCQDCL